MQLKFALMSHENAAKAKQTFPESTYWPFIRASRVFALADTRLPSPQEMIEPT